MKKVLILCDLFPPAFGPRMGYLCKYLAQSDWRPVVVTEKVDSCNFQLLENICEVHEVNFYPLKSSFGRKLQWIGLQALSLFFDYKDYKIKKEAESILHEQKFDLILCSSYRTFPLPATEQLAEQYKIPFIADLRDIIEQYAGDEFISHPIPDIPFVKKWIVNRFRKKSLSIRNRILKKAACVTTISEWHQEWLKQFNPNVYLIYNGYDPELFYPEKIQTGKFIIIYTGRILSLAMRDPTLLFQGLRELASQGVISPDFCRVHWYVDPVSWSLIDSEANKYGVREYMDMKGFVPAPAIPHLLNCSSVLLILTNKSTGDGPKGVMTTKLFESMAVRKPILCIRNDEGVLEKTLRKTQAGIAASNVDEVCAFLGAAIQQWKEYGYTSSPVRTDAIEPYSRKGQALQFIQLFNRYSNNMPS
ncbi:MAG TPA: hypothetical protein DDZ04_03555 [Parabacteroides sp.]|nr:hypothetical protein [Parabacteroides sp.]